jgi:CBS-domain-containing membrane protein
MKVSDVMTTDVVSVRTNTPFRTIVRLLDETGCSGLPVVDETRRVVGMVSSADLVVKSHRANDVGIGAPAEHRRRAEGLVAGDLMSTPAVTIDAETDLRVAARVMTLHRIRRVVVTRRRELAGIITRGDVLKSFFRADADIEREIKQVILGHKVAEEAPGVLVSVEDGVVYLRGTVKRRSTARVIGFHVDRLDGVTKVVNELSYDVDDTESFSIAPPPVGPLEMVL